MRVSATGIIHLSLLCGKAANGSEMIVSATGFIPLIFIGKQPVAQKINDCLGNRILSFHIVIWKSSQRLGKNLVQSTGKQLQESINRCSVCCNKTEIMLKTALTLYHTILTFNDLGKEDI